MEKIVELIPERLRSRKLGFSAVLVYILTQLKTFGIEISPELQAYLITGVGSLWMLIQGIQDIVTAWRKGGINAAVEVVAEAIKPAVDKPEG
jgi:hypothetical protein